MEASRASRLVRHRADPDPLTARQAAVGRAVQYVRGNFRAGESFTDLAEAQNRVEIWCREMAVMRVHRATARRPVEMFAELEAGCLRPLPEPCDQPVFTRVKVHRDYHGEVARALSSVLSICSARAWTPASTASAGPFLVFAPSSRQKEGGDQQHAGQVSTQVRSARRHGSAPWILKWSLAA